MRKLGGICLFTIFLFAASCHKSQLSSAVRPGNLDLGACLSQTFGDEQVTICLEEVISDSRCAIDATCIWAGSALARFRFVQGGQTHSVILATLAYGGYTTSAIVAGYKIEFVNLYPLPQLIPPLPEPNSKQRAEVKITKI